MAPVLRTLPYAYSRPPFRYLRLKVFLYAACGGQMLRVTSRLKQGYVGGHISTTAISNTSCDHNSLIPDASAVMRLQHRHLLLSPRRRGQTLLHSLSASMGRAPVSLVHLTFVTLFLFSFVHALDGMQIGTLSAGIDIR